MAGFSNEQKKAYFSLFLFQIWGFMLNSRKSCWSFVALFRVKSRTSKRNLWRFPPLMKQIPGGQSWWMISFFSNSEEMPAGGESHLAQGNSCADVGEVVQRLQRPRRAQLPLRVEFICHLSHEHDGLQHREALLDAECEQIHSSLLIFRPVLLCLCHEIHLQGAYYKSKWGRFDSTSTRNTAVLNLVHLIHIKSVLSLNTGHNSDCCSLKRILDFWALSSTSRSTSSHIMSCLAWVQMLCFT